jgi:N-acetylneuraminic acid mutarotase
VTAFNLADRRWSTYPHLPSARHHAAAAVLDGVLYVSGGASGGGNWTPRSQLWRLDLSADSPAWQTMAPMPEGRLGHRQEAVGGQLYVVGGQGGRGRVLVYDPAGDSWAMAAAMPVPRDHLGTVVIDGEIWAIGGRTSGEVLTRVDIYDIAADQWRAGPRLPEPMSAMAIGVVGGAIHSIGGENPRLLGGGVIDAHVMLDSAADRWERGPRALLPVHGPASGVLDGQLVVVGGAARQGGLSAIAWTAVTQAFSPPAPHP